jgi:putative ATP-dependent endonuclease of the OLD family
VTPDTINSVIRVYKEGAEGSRKVALSEVGLPNKAKLVRMINSQNNERLFFADKVVLVEGPSDRLVFSSLLEAVAARVGDNSAIEVVDVGGKHNFESHQLLLDGLRTRWVTIADRDYLGQVGSPQVKALFHADSKSATNSVLDDKRSVDRATLMRDLRQAIKNDNVGRLEELLSYIESRHRQLTIERSEDAAVLAADCCRLEKLGVVLLDGEIEDYLPAHVSDIADMVELVSDRNWISRVTDLKRREHLAAIAGVVLGLSPPDRSALLDAVKAGGKVFPDPIVQ